MTNHVAKMVVIRRRDATSRMNRVMTIMYPKYGDSAPDSMNSQVG